MTICRKVLFEETQGSSVSLSLKTSIERTYMYPWLASWVEILFIKMWDIPPGCCFVCVGLLNELVPLLWYIIHVVTSMTIFKTVNRWKSWIYAPEMEFSCFFERIYGSKLNEADDWRFVWRSRCRKTTSSLVITGRTAARVDICGVERQLPVANGRPGERIPLRVFRSSFLLDFEKPCSVCFLFLR